MNRFVVVAGGPSTEMPCLSLSPDAVIIAADSGADRALRAGWPVHHLVGDLDSVSDLGLAHARSSGARVDRFAPAKDHTDLELALDVAIAEGAERIDVVLDPGGRFDHLLVAAHVLAADAYSAATVCGWVGATRVLVVRGAAHFEGEVGDLVTLVPIGGSARVTTINLEFPLREEWLEPASGRGLSNRLSGGSWGLEVSSGVILAVLPG